MKALQTGAIAEAYVYYRLLSWGYDVHFASGISSPFDLWLNYKGIVIKIQVKGTSCTEKRSKVYRDSSTYCFMTSKGGGKKTLYEDDDFDILALVGLPHEKIYFTRKYGGKRRRISTKKFNEETERETWEKCFHAHTKEIYEQSRR